MAGPKKSQSLAAAYYGTVNAPLWGNVYVSVR